MMRETATMTLTEFLLARINEDEADARLASRVLETQRGDQWEVNQRITCDEVNVAGVAQTRRVADVHRGATHIARHDPTRVLAECEAKRRIVDLHALRWVERPERVIGERDDPACETCWFDDGWPCATIKALAAVYADHHDYREEWRP